jgi:hypothetical protein
MLSALKRKRIAASGTTPKEVLQAFAQAVVDIALG